MARKAYEKQIATQTRVAQITATTEQAAPDAEVNAGREKCVSRLGSCGGGYRHFRCDAGGGPRGLRERGGPVSIERANILCFMFIFRTVLAESTGSISERLKWSRLMLVDVVGNGGPPGSSSHISAFPASTGPLNNTGALRTAHRYKRKDSSILSTCQLP